MVFRSLYTVQFLFIWINYLDIFLLLLVLKYEKIFWMREKFNPLISLCAYFWQTNKNYWNNSVKPSIPWRIRLKYTIVQYTTH